MDNEGKFKIPFLGAPIHGEAVNEGAVEAFTASTEGVQLNNLTPFVSPYGFDISPFIPSGEGRKGATRIGSAARREQGRRDGRDGKSHFDRIFRRIYERKNALGAVRAQ